MKTKMTKTKRSGYLMLFILACAVCATSCKKSDDGGPGGGAAPGLIQAKVGGASFKSLKMTTMANRINVAGASVITLQGSETSGKAIVLVMNGVSETGTYSIGGGANISISASYTEVNVSNPTDTKIWQAPFDSSVAGEIKIAELTDKSIKGTFSFTAKSSSDSSTKEITDGAFNLSF